MTETPAPDVAAGGDVPEGAPMIYAAMIGVMADIGPIAKDRRVSEGPARFTFRGVDDVMNGVHDPFVRHGVFVLPSVLERLTETRQTSKGGSMNVVHLHVRFTFYARDGSNVSGTAWGEAQDSGDKATGKAHSMAYKTALLEALSVATQDMGDADAVNEPAGPYTYPLGGQECAAVIYQADTKEEIDVASRRFPGGKEAAEREQVADPGTGEVTDLLTFAKTCRASLQDTGEPLRVRRLKRGEVSAAQDAAADGGTEPADPGAVGHHETAAERAARIAATIGGEGA